MASYIDLDSIYRDTDVYPNENDYQLFPAQTQTWFRSARTISAFPSNPNLQPLEFATTVNIVQLTTPYSEFLVDEPRLYVNFRCLKYDDRRLIFCADGVHPEAKFVCFPHQIQKDANDNPVWIHWKSTMEQTMRFERGYPVQFQLETRNGGILPSLDNSRLDPSKQTLCTFEITPYIRDGDYDNQMVQTFTS